MRKVLKEVIGNNPIAFSLKTLPHKP